MWRLNARRYPVLKSFVSVARSTTKSIRLQSSLPDPKSYLEKYQPGDVRHGYVVKRVVPVHEYNMVAVELEHNRSGAHHLHLARADKHNSFSVGFRTTPSDNTGVPHILEHTTLCGSQKYPCRDPFFRMLNRTLSTFMNAMTDGDHTVYPFSTMNSADYKNLLQIYMDAVFFPNLLELDFCQEGWRLEHEDVKSSDSPITIKGVVFNEMKGCLSTIEDVFYYSFQMKLLPSTTYGVISGGDPLCIPDLTWDDLKKFHRTLYHPSNCLFVTYGDMCLDTQLQMISEMALDKFERQPPQTLVTNQPRWSEPREAVIQGPYDPLSPNPDKQTIFARGYMMNDVSDPKETLLLKFLSKLLVDGPNSPFYQALITSNIGSQFSPFLGYCNSTKDALFGIGLQGLHPSDVDRVKSIIQSTFENSASEGFQDYRIDAILHEIELSMKSVTTSFGLHQVLSATAAWVRGGDAIRNMMIAQRVEEFRESISADKDLLKNKVREYFLQNPHRLDLTLQPDVDYSSTMLKKNHAVVDAKVKHLSADDRKMIYERGLKLEEEQNKPPNVACLPKVYLEDIDKKCSTTEFEEVNDIVPVYLFPQPTNGISYFRAMSSITSLPYVLKPYVPLFCYTLTQMGAARSNYIETDQRIRQYTGGLSMSAFVSSHHTKDNTFEQAIFFSSACLDRNLAHMFLIWEDFFLTPVLDDKDRLRTLIQEYTSSLVNSISNSGHVYAQSLANNSLTPAARLVELFSGVTQVQFMRSLAEGDDLDTVIDSMVSIASYVLTKSGLRCSLNMLPETSEHAYNTLAAFLGSLPDSSAEESGEVHWDKFTPSAENDFIEMPYQVNYSASSIKTVPMMHPDFPVLKVAAKLVAAKYLHREIREKGGAYGGMAHQSGGIFSMASYRDPHVVRTLDTYNKAVQWLSKGEFSDEDVEEAQISVLADMDKPVAPGSKGLGLFTSGISDEMRSSLRHGYFSISRGGIVEVCQKYLSSEGVVKATAVIGPDSSPIIGSGKWKVTKHSEKDSVSSHK